MALGEEVKRLQETSAALLERVRSQARAIRKVEDAHAETARILADLRRDSEREIALLMQEIESRAIHLRAEQERELAALRREIEELKNWKAETKKQGEEWSRRIWAFGPNLVAAVIGGLIAAGFAYFIPRH
jgi:hypothetical protein